MHFLSLGIIAAPPWRRAVWIIQASLCLLIYERDGAAAAELRHESGLKTYIKKKSTQSPDWLYAACNI